VGVRGAQEGAGKRRGLHAGQRGESRQQTACDAYDPVVHTACHMCQLTSPEHTPQRQA
jgi:hypothetical protein